MATETDDEGVVVVGETSIVIGLVGCSAAGKSTLVDALEKATPGCSISVVTCDDYYRKLDLCPTFDLEGLPWPNGSVPEAFKARGNADLNVPGAVNWMGALRRIHDLQLESEEAAAEVTRKALDRKTRPPSVVPRVILVEGLLLLGDDETAASVRREVMGEGGGTREPVVPLCHTANLFFLRPHSGGSLCRARVLSGVLQATRPLAPEAPPSSPRQAVLQREGGDGGSVSDLLGYLHRATVAGARAGARRFHLPRGLCRHRRLLLYMRAAAVRSVAPYALSNTVKLRW